MRAGFVRKKGSVCEEGGGQWLGVVMMGWGSVYAGGRLYGGWQCL